MGRTGTHGCGLWREPGGEGAGLRQGPGVGAGNRVPIW